MSGATRANDLSDGEFGLTKREMFAAMAMQGILADVGICVMRTGDGANVNQVAEEAVKAADALIAELSRTRS